MAAHWLPRHCLLDTWASKWKQTPSSRSSITNNLRQIDKHLWKHAIQQGFCTFMTLLLTPLDKKWSIASALIQMLNEVGFLTISYQNDVKSQFYQMSNVSTVLKALTRTLISDWRFIQNQIKTNWQWIYNVWYNIWILNSWVCLYQWFWTTIFEF